ncbi:MAG: hypothetical protein OSB45_08225 [Pseudomonadales bacterium]|nr:hypothetical protein [Pseudomonadales bacterium]
MPNIVKIRMRSALELTLAFIPWLLSLYLLYWLEYSESWTSLTAHRGKMAVAILMAGMILSFLIQSNFIKRKRKTTTG